MPRKKTAKTLKQCCFRKLARSFDKIWMTDFNENFHELPRLLYVIGPFDNLTNEMIQCLINSLIEEKCLKRRYFTVLMQMSVTTLDLSKGGIAANNDSVIKTVTTRCPKLVSLNLESLNSISARALCDMVSQLTALKTLNLKQTNCNDQVLSVIGHRSLNLLDLDISSTKTSNSGAYSLCQSFTTDSTTGCRNLIKLQIFGTMINAAGALYLLQNLPKLHYLGFDDVCSIIEMDTNEGQGQAYKLRNLFSHGLKVHPVTKESLELSCLLCPHTQEARFYSSAVCNTTVAAIKHLKEIKNLGLGNCGDTVLTFEAGVLPVLMEVGGHLSELTLADVNDFDLVSLGQQCKNLRNLSILISSMDDSPPAVFTPLSTSDRRTLFDKLENISIVYPLEEIHFQINALAVLLKNAKGLKSITIRYMQTLTTELLLDVWNDNPFCKLEKLKLVSCDNVGAEFIDLLIQGENNLSVLELHKCRSLSFQDSERYKKLVRKQNLDLEFIWIY